MYFFMKAQILITLMTISLASISYGQAGIQNYSHLINDAEDLFKQGEYENAAEKYKEAFDVFGGKGGLDDKYNFAKAYILSGDQKTAFFHLFNLARATKHYGLSNITKVKDDINFNSLHNDKRWEELLNIINKNKKELEVNLDKELTTLLDEVFEDDQKYRKAYIDLMSEKGRESDETKASFKQMKKWTQLI
jgi:tetratricopeptide (TPR) repeat protein